MINGQYIVLSFKEWNNWIAQGLLKIHNYRIQPYLNSKHSFFNLMNTGADITHLDDNEYILAVLSKSYSSSTYQSEHTLANYIGLEAVQQFYALTERGKIALNHSANNLQVSLATDLEIEKFWEAYRLDQKNILEHEKALKFTGLIFENKISPEALVDLVNNKTLNQYFNPTKYEISYLQAQDEQAKKQLFSLESFDKTRAYAGMFTRFLFNLEVNDHILLEKYKEIAKLCGSKEYYLSLKDQQTTDQLTSKFLSKQILREKTLTEYILLESQIKHLPLLALSLYFHYEMLIKYKYPLNLSALKEDIFNLDFFYAQSECTEYKSLSYLVVYALGKLLPDEFINTLYYYKSNRYPCFHTTHQADLEHAFPNIADEDFLQTTLNELNEEISKNWTEFNNIFNAKLSAITHEQNTKDTQASVLTQQSLSTNITHSSENPLKASLPSTLTTPQPTDLLTSSMEEQNNSLESPVKTMTSKQLIIQQTHAIPIDQCENIETQASSIPDSQEQIDLILEPGLNKEVTPTSITNDTINTTQNPLVQKLIQLFDSPDTVDFKSLMTNLKKDPEFHHITKQEQLRDKLVSAGILDNDCIPKSGPRLFELIKKEIIKKS